MNKTITTFFKKNLLFFVVIGVLAIIEAWLFLWQGNNGFALLRYFHKTPASPPGIILFEGSPCSHCAVVETFIKQNAIEKNVTFTRLEVFHNATNADILADKAQTCGLNPQTLGVPLVWDGAHCIIGETDVIRFFSQKKSKNP